jgi:hypothetical protein
MKVSYFINNHNDIAVCRRHSRFRPLNSEPILPDQLPQVKYERQLQLIQTEEKVASHSLRRHQLITGQTQMNSMRPVLIGAAKFNRS